MSFDIKAFLDRHNIFYREHGTGVKRGNVIIHCPYCGSDDKGEHLGISLSNGVWGCWRNSSHRGKDLAKLIINLIPISYAQARKLIGADNKVIEIDLFDEIATDGYFKNDTDKTKSLIRTLLLPKDFREFGSRASSPFESYLESRGFVDVLDVADTYNLKFAVTGPYKGRIIMPVYFNGQLVTWTSRAINNNASLRYRSLGEDDSSINIKKTIYNFDRASEGGDVLFIVEGPVDTLKVDYYLIGMEAHAVGLFSMTISDDQLYWLIQLFDKYNTVVLLLDSGETESSDKGIALLSSTGKDINEGELPKGVSDPGELKAYQIKNMYKKWSNRNGKEETRKTKRRGTRTQEERESKTKRRGDLQ